MGPRGGPSESQEQGWATGTERSGQKDVFRTPEGAGPESRGPETPAWPDPAQKGRLLAPLGQTVAEVWRSVISVFALGSVAPILCVSVTFTRTL